MGQQQDDSVLGAFDVRMEALAKGIVLLAFLDSMQQHRARFIAGVNRLDQDEPAQG